MMVHNEGFICWRQSNAVVHGNHARHRDRIVEGRRRLFQGEMNSRRNDPMQGGPDASNATLSAYAFFYLPPSAPTIGKCRG